MSSRVVADAALTEREKMLAGLPYMALRDESLSRSRLRAKRLCHAYGLLEHASLDHVGDGLTRKHKEILAELFGISMEQTRSMIIEPPLWVDYGFHTSFGFCPNFFFYAGDWDQNEKNTGLTILDCAKVYFGTRTIIAPHVSIYAATHSVSDVAARRDEWELAYEVVIGNDVWIGGKAVLVGPLIVGDGATIAAGAVVSKDVEPFTVVGGNPARLLRRVDPVPPKEGDPVTPTTLTARKPRGA